MRFGLASRIMRTTIDIDDPVLKDLKRLQKRQGKSLGRLVSDLLAQALAWTCRTNMPCSTRWMTPTDELRYRRQHTGARVRFRQRAAREGRRLPDPMRAPLYTHDRDFRKFPFLDVRDPLDQGR